MSRINHAIPVQSFEIVRVRLGVILTDELNNQFTNYAIPEAECSIQVEGSDETDDQEMSYIQISLQEGVYQNQHPGSRTAPYRFNIDCFCSSKQQDNIDGAMLSKNKVQRLAGLVSSILSDPLYGTLGFVPPFITRVLVNSIKVGEADPKDAMNCVGARVSLDVTVNETESMALPVLIQGYQTTVTLFGVNINNYYLNPPIIP